MNYKFRLQKVLDVKEKQEDKKKNEVYIANKELITALEELDCINKELEEKFIERQDLNQKGTSIMQIRQLNEYIDYLKVLIENKHKEIEKLKEKADTKKQEYIDSRKERKSYENLKEKDKARYMRKEAKEEEKIIDEIVSFSARKI